MDYYLKPSAVRDLKRLPKIIQRRIFNKLDFYIKQSSNPLKFASALKDKTIGSFRFRVGDYRVLFDIKSDKIIILKIGYRKEIYK